MDHLGSANTTLLPSAMDLVLVLPRLAQRAGSFAVSYLPDSIGGMKDILFSSGSVIADATGQRILSNATNTSAVFLQTTSSAAAESYSTSWLPSTDQAAASMFGMVIHIIGKLKTLGGVFSYLTSRWALATFTAAIVLNRAQFYASTRQNLHLRWYIRMSIYLVPIMAFIYQMHIILQSLRCQTSPQYSAFRYGVPGKNIPMDFGGEGGFLYDMSSTLLWWQTDEQCCKARKMALGSDATELKGSMSLLFYFFITLCVSQLFDTLACALQGRKPVPETGMTIFEHSLAFAECEAMVSSAIGLGVFGLPKLEQIVDAAADGDVLFTRGEILQRLNVPPEVLLVCLISCLSHWSSATLAIAGIRDKVRLVNTGVWACCYMSAFLWSFFRVFSQPLQNITDLGVLRFPTVCIVGFIPHVIILTGIILCSIIYGYALILTAFSVPDSISNGMTYTDRVQWAYQNLQANVQFSQSTAIRIRMSEDFYTTILKIGFHVLTAASEAVYLNEGMEVHVPQTTWLERDRLEELTAKVERRRLAIPVELQGNEIANGVDFIDHQSGIIASPYARERRSKQRQGESSRHAEMDSGLGIMQRKNRLHLTFDFIMGMVWLALSLYAHLCLATLRSVGLRYRPAWLLRIAGCSEKKKSDQSQQTLNNDNSQDFYLMTPDGRLQKAEGDQIDVEREWRQRADRQGTYQGEEHLSESIYRWWRDGGWFGEIDATSDYYPADPDDDITSIVSLSTDASANEWSDDDDDDGRRTPTQQQPYNNREASPIEDRFEASTLARLLNPQTSADQDEALMLSYSLLSDRPVTRSRFRRAQDLQRSRLVRGTVPALTMEDEERDLERFILERRDLAKSNHKSSDNWANGAAGMGESGPQCVVCQSTPRTILVWPCGCLSMCDDCRVGLAARNYTKCICCRTDIAAYSRLFVP